eukprot:733150-Ditylum_brightwellii.AAC.1
MHCASSYGHVEGWKLASFIMKTGEDICCEALMMYIISKLYVWLERDMQHSDRNSSRVEYLDIDDISHIHLWVMMTTMTMKK